MKEPLKKYKKDALRAAKDLCYPEEVLDRIRNATRQIDIEHIMYDARNAD